VTNESVEVRAQWPGLVEAVLVAVGQAVTVGEPLLTVESMKMLTDVESPVAGEVTQVAVAAGEAVDEGALLVVIARA